MTRTWPMEAHHFAVSLTHRCFSLVTQPHRLPPWRPATAPPPTFTSPSLSPPNPKPTSHSRSSCSTTCRRWDSNAETIRSQGFKFNFKGRDNKQDLDQDYEADDDEDKYAYGAAGKKRRWWSDKSGDFDEGPDGVSEEAIDTFWIFKIFNSYGWMLPIITLSWLTASGPKAILMALALPLGQSVLSLAFDKLWGKAESKPSRKSRMRRKSSVRNASGVGAKQEYETPHVQNRKKGYQSWVDETDNSVHMGSQNTPKFGGWDELDKFGSTPRSSATTQESRRNSRGKSKLSRRHIKSDTSLLLRLLIAVFPFLWSWTKMLW